MIGFLTKKHMILGVKTHDFEVKIHENATKKIGF